MLVSSTATSRSVARASAHVSILPISGYIFISETTDDELSAISLMNQRFFTVAALARRLGYTRSWIYKLHSRGQLRSFTNGGRLLFVESEVLGWLANRSLAKEVVHG